MKNKNNNHQPEDTQEEILEHIEGVNTEDTPEVDETLEQEVAFEDLSPEEQVAFLQAESAEHLAGWKRAQADYQNLKKTTQQEKLDTLKYGNARLMEALIPLFDNLELAVKHVPAEVAENPWTQGVTYIVKQMNDVLAEQGVEIIDPQGQTFDPHHHEAVEMVEQEGTEPNTVVDVLQVGYRLNDRVIRSARVKVSS